MRNLKKLSFLILLSAFAFVVKANTEKPDALLHGYVTDAITKKPVSGVLVSATAPGVTGFKEATTDADGYFSFGQLPAQQVNLQFGKKGYQIYKRINILVKEKTSLKITVEFFPEGSMSESDESEYPLLRMLQFE
jgi:hypothetical protein